MTNTELLKTVSDLKSLKNMADEIADQIAALEDAIKAEMTVDERTDLGLNPLLGQGG